MAADKCWATADSSIASVRGSVAEAGGAMAAASPDAATQSGGGAGGAGPDGGAGGIIVVHPPSDAGSECVDGGRRPVSKIDLLFMIDNSSSMADKQAILAAAVPDL